MTRRITHLLTHRVAIGMVMSRSREPVTERQIGTATGFDLTTVHNSLREMEMMGLATRAPCTGRFAARAKTCKYVWVLTEKARGL